MLGSLVSKETSATFGHLIADSKAAASLKMQVVQLTSDLQESKQTQLDLNDQVAALKADLLLKAQKSDLLAAQESANSLKKELEQVRGGAVETIARLKTDLQLATEDVCSRSKDQEALNAMVKSLTGQLDALKQELRIQRPTLDKYKAAFEAEMQKTSEFDEEVHSLKEQIERLTFARERAERAQAALRTELNQVKTQLRMIQISEK
ncbi:hypothetical protein R1sor_013596 [Riccia sorocarpa]|uniref:Uncharacterized protein n=1 Tax=Riccia sorocarpa TaxID=122646 RepID=A0ABD3H705_9MARC